MQTRYYLEHSINVPNAGSSIIRVGMPIPSDMQNNICVCCQGSYDFIPLNASVLRQALLSNPQKTEELLGIKVTDIHAPKETIKKEVKKK